MEGHRDHCTVEMSVLVGLRGIRTVTYSETFEMAILMVNRNEKAISTRCSRILRRVSLKYPSWSRTRHPIAAEVE